jgi:hypothetical protein
MEYNEAMRLEYNDFKGKWEDIKRKAIREYGLAGVSGAGAIITGSIDSRLLWLPVAATVPLLKSISDTAYERSSLKRNPLYVFLKLNYGDKRF